MILVLAEQQRSFVGRHREAVCCIAREGSDRCYLACGEVQLPDGLGFAPGKKVNSSLADGKVVAFNRAFSRDLNFFASIHGYSPETSVGLLALQLVQEPAVGGLYCTTTTFPGHLNGLAEGSRWSPSHLPDLMLSRAVRTEVNPFPIPGPA